MAEISDAASEAAVTLTDSVGNLVSGANLTFFFFAIDFFVLVGLPRGAFFEGEPFFVGVVGFDLVLFVEDGFFCFMAAEVGVGVEGGEVDPRDRSLATTFEGGRAMRVAFLVAATLRRETIRTGKAVKRLVGEFILCLLNYAFLVLLRESG